ncbi:hypothetical protein LJK88_24275 [Paenibacillus sp. P26]|nr:hypothetical protein LJK88_24275 [Paenibacillus sp. P26]
MGKRRAMLVMTVLSCLILPGCWDRRELNEIGLVTALGIDKAGDQYELTAQFVNPGEIASKEGGGGEADGHRQPFIPPREQPSSRRLSECRLRLRGSSISRICRWRSSAKRWPGKGWVKCWITYRGTTKCGRISILWWQRAKRQGRF